MATSSRYTPELSKETLDSITRAFQLFQDKNGIIKCEYLINALKDLKYDQQEPVVYDVVQEVCSSNKTLSFDEFVSKFNEQLQDKNSQKNTERYYALFAANPDGNMTFEDFVKIARETGDNAPEDELKKIFNFASSNGKDIPYEEFHAVMTKSLTNN